MKRTCLVLLLAVGCSKGPSEGQCKQLLDHLVDLEIKKAGATANTDQVKVDLAKQKAAVLDSKQPEFMSLCTEKIAKPRVECALAATDLEAVAKCDL
jgi:tRNA U34 5-carboxymethylaminomethyl modifying enzyme MnmG/GidA